MDFDKSLIKWMNIKEFKVVNTYFIGSDVERYLGVMNFKVSEYFTWLKFVE